MINNNIITISIDARLISKSSSKASQTNGGSVGDAAPRNSEDRERLRPWQDKVTLTQASSRNDQGAMSHEQAYLMAGRNARRGTSTWFFGGYGNYVAHGETSSAALPPGLPYATPMSGSQAAAEALPANEFLALPMGPDSTTYAYQEDKNSLAGQASASGSRKARGDVSPSSERQDKIGSEVEAALSSEEKAEVEELKARDREVRSHEQAHISAGGSLVQGVAAYDMTVGPDGKSYVVGGEVQIDASRASTPDSTISKAQQVRAAAMAPSQPSTQDMQVAAQATQMEMEARQEKLEENSEEDASGAKNTDEQSQTPGNSDI